jgi:hypothetical protein
MARTTSGRGGENSGYQLSNFSTKPKSRGSFSEPSRSNGKQVLVKEPVLKTATELELERLVFGDDTGFKEGLKSHNELLRQQGAEILEDEDEGTVLDDGDDFAAIQDADVCSSTLLQLSLY